MLRSFVEAVGKPECRIAVLGGGEPLESLLGGVFGGQVPVSAADGSERSSDVPLDVPDALGDDDLGHVVLLEDGAVVAHSSMSEVYDAILAVNSDLFVTGTREAADVELPDVLAALDDVRFRLRGYPLAHKEKLFLIVVSRWIERRAQEADAGTLRSSFQRLSRIEDEMGTRDVYASVADSAVDVHVYGVADADVGLDVTVHTGTNAEYRRSWFVVFRPDDPAVRPAALVCFEVEPRVWDGFFTYDRDRTVAIDEYISTEL